MARKFATTKKPEDRVEAIKSLAIYLRATELTQNQKQTGGFFGSLQALAGSLMGGGSASSAPNLLALPPAVTPLALAPH